MSWSSGGSLSSKSWGFVDSGLGSRLRYLIRILRSLDIGLGLELAPVLVVGLPSLLEQ